MDASITRDFATAGIRRVRAVPGAPWPQGSGVRPRDPRRPCRCAGVAWAAVLSLSGLLLAPSSVLASSRSQAMHAKGLLAFQGQQWEEAYRFFDSAVREDPGDAAAVYYRGLTAGKLGNWGAALEDVERAVELRPELPGGALDAGILRLEAQQYPEAEAWLQRAHEQPRDRFRAALFLGMIRYRTGDDEGARRFFSEAERDPALRLAGQYYRALALLRQGHGEEAEALLKQVQTDGPSTDMGRLAAQYLAGSEQSSDGGRRARPWTLDGAVGFEYDSNVVLAPTDEEIKATRPIGREGDARGRVELGGSYRLVDADWIKATLAYDFYQSVHLNLRAFDLQGHRVRLDLASRPGGLRYGIAGQYAFYALNYQSYFQQGQGMPWLTVSEGDVAATQLFYRFRSRDFLRSPFEPYRDALNNAVGVRQSVRLGAAGRFLSVGYQFDDEAPESGHGDDFEAHGHQMDVRLDAPLGDWGSVTAGYQLRLDEYKESNSRSWQTDVDPGLRRHDAEHQLGIRIEHEFTAQVSAAISYIGVLHHSNLDPFDYDRNIVSSELRYRF